MKQIVQQLSNVFEAVSLIRKPLFNSLFVALFLMSCTPSVPKPYAYFRFDFPEKKYKHFDMEASPFSFDYHEKAVLEANNDFSSMNVVYEQYNTTIHLTYKRINLKTFDILTEDAYRMVYEHSGHADAIEAKAYENPHANVSGVFYELGGEVACAVQFVASDSTTHWLRGALYIDATPKRDSLNPIIEYVKKDMEYLLESLKWKS